jgi:SsrA-binding protein
MNKNFSKKINIRNRKASFEYTFLDTFTAGMVLKGTEIKSIRMGKANLSDSYCYINKGELFVKNLNISAYDNGTYNNHEPLRERKLLLTKREIRKLDNQLKDKGLTIIVTSLFISDNGYAKMGIALAKGKKLYDKRESIKERDVNRELQRH